MFRRYCNPLLSHSFFLFGPRGTGKSSLLHNLFNKSKSLWFDLLDPKQERLLASHPEYLSQIIDQKHKNLEWIIIDEVQKIPQLLDIVHSIIESPEAEKRKLKFALSGSSARKLKRQGVNLLAGRAFVYSLFPLTCIELGNSFNLYDVLRWGTLPQIYSLKTDEEKELFLDAYIHTYFKEEIVAEQIIRNVEPFRRFLEVCAQANGTILNYSKIAEDLRIDSKTVKSYFSIIEDTLLGFLLPTYHKSIRKQQILSPKFYLFDCGVKRTLENLSAFPLANSTELGLAFEHFLVCEIMRLNSYFRKKYKLYYLASKGGLEIDLILERPKQKTALVEIKWAEQVTERHLQHLSSIIKEKPEFEAFCLCREPLARKFNNIHILPWREGIKKLGLHSN